METLPASSHCPTNACGPPATKGLNRRRTSRTGARRIGRLISSPSLPCEAEGAARLTIMTEVCPRPSHDARLHIQYRGCARHARSTSGEVSPYVFAAYTEQLREHYRRGPYPQTAKIVGAEFDPELLYRWLHTKIRKWADVMGRERASHHSFRKTGLQTVKRGDNRNEEVAKDGESPSP